MKVLVACEESQRVCKAFRKKGHMAFSCDIIECSGNKPEYHIKSDVLKIINGDTAFITQDGEDHFIYGSWDLIIAHPPCTYLTCAGNKWFKEEYKDRFPDREKQRKDAIDFFVKIANANCDKIAIENLVGIMSTIYRKPDQIIQPFLFGDPYRKKTCLWLKNLPNLIPTKIVEPKLVYFSNGKTMSEDYYIYSSLPGEERSKQRSKTYHGIANAMADQWGLCL